MSQCLLKSKYWELVEISVIETLCAVAKMYRETDLSWYYLVLQNCDECLSAMLLHLLCDLSPSLTSCWFYHHLLHGHVRVGLCLLCNYTLFVEEKTPANSISLSFVLRCSSIDIVLLSSDVIITCLECGRENSTKGLSYGQSKFTWCRKCHSKLTLFAEQCKFIQHQPGSFLAAPLGDSSSGRKNKRKLDEGIKEGYPLPETGTCVHYKKSHRWLR